MISGITTRQVEEALGIEGTGTHAMVSEWPRRFTPKGKAVPHKYEVVLNGELDVSMHELQALVALFGTVHVCGKYLSGGMGHAEDDPSTFYFEVSE